MCTLKMLSLESGIPQIPLAVTGSIKTIFVLRSDIINDIQIYFGKKPAFILKTIILHLYYVYCETIQKEQIQTFQKKYLNQMICF